MAVELADTAVKRAQGLSGRDSLPENRGMLFIFPEETLPTFWMKDMKFSLDFIWVRGAKVVTLHPNVPSPEATATDLALYSPSEPIHFVLEVNAGFIAKHHIAVGDSIRINLGSH